MANQQVRFESLSVGDFFKTDERSAITYQVRERDGIIGRVREGYNTRTGKMEHVFGFVVPVAPMTDSAIQAEQEDHRMWGEIAANHDRILKADIA